MRQTRLLSFMFIACASFFPLFAQSTDMSTFAKDLNWVASNENRCGGYYIEQPYVYSPDLVNNNQIQITSSEPLLFSLHGTSVGQGKVTITRFGQQIVANKAYVTRDPQTGKFSAIDLENGITLREPNSLVLAKAGHFDLKTKGESLYEILYRTVVFNRSDTAHPLLELTKVTQLSAWGSADKFEQNQALVYEFDNASYSTCPPLNNAWQVKAGHIELNKNTGRGTARNARVYVRGVPIFYTPYLNFPIDTRRQTGFLTPTLGTSSKTGAYVRLPFYWNIAANDDATLTPAYLSKRGVQFSGLFRYLTPRSFGNVSAAILPNDRAFNQLKQSYQAQFGSSTNSFTQAELNRLENASDTRKSFAWQNNTVFNSHWSADVDYSRVSDDYYLTDLSNNLNEVTQNQLLEQGEVNYRGENWKFLGRVQGYQTLHPVNQTVIPNQYTRLPQIAIDANYPHQWKGLEYALNVDLTHFTIVNTPGNPVLPPFGNRFNLQPAISWPFARTDFFFNPRLQLALTKYELQQVPNNQSTGPSRVLPIFDISSGINLDRHTTVFKQNYRQTLEPQIYYTYIPYRNQDEIPLFDTGLNTLTYDELFTYNRFSGLDRIGDANQISYGIMTRFIDEQTGYEKLRAGLGQILYFKNRLVTLCTTSTPLSPCIDPPDNPQNNVNKSPLSAMLTYNLNPHWSLSGNTIWNAQFNEFDNQLIGVHYQPEAKKIINLSYSFVRGGDFQTGDAQNASISNLQQTDLSFAWPLSRDWSSVGRWTQNWNHHHFQNLLYGLQYDSCCWAVRFVTGRTFALLSPDNTYQYDTQFFIQFALKGLGNYGNNDPSQLLSGSIAGYQMNFGQDF